MNNIELIKTLMKLVKHLDDKNSNSCDICLHDPAGSIIKCYFHYEVKLPEDNND